MELIAGLANGFIELFKAGAATFTGWVTGIIPLVVIMMTAVNSLIKLIGEDRVNGIAQIATKYTITRYTVLPVLAVIFLANPMCYTFGRCERRRAVCLHGHRRRHHRARAPAGRSCSPLLHRRRRGHPDTRHRDRAHL